MDENREVFRLHDPEWELVYLGKYGFKVHIRPTGWFGAFFVMCGKKLIDAKTARPLVTIDMMCRQCLSRYRSWFAKSGGGEHGFGDCISR